MGQVEPGDMEDEVKNKFKALKEMHSIKSAMLTSESKRTLRSGSTFPLSGDLRDPAMRDRHWAALKGQGPKRLHRQ
jgi:hypothetical protein